MERVGTARSVSSDIDESSVYTVISDVMCAHLWLQAEFPVGVVESKLRLFLLQNLGQWLVDTQPLSGRVHHMSPRSGRETELQKRISQIHNNLKFNYMCVVKLFSSVETTEYKEHSYCS